MIERLHQMISNSEDKRNKSYSDELDSNFNFRCNSDLKEDFKALCKANQVSPSAALKRYMLQCTRASKIV